MEDKLLAKTVNQIESAKKNLSWSVLKTGLGGTGSGDNVLTGYSETQSLSGFRIYPCHNPIRSFQNASVLWSCFGHRTNKTTAKFFLKWLIHKSPWSKTGLLVDHNLDLDFVYDHGFVFDGLTEVSANLLHNFLIASRVCVEWPAYAAAWHNLVVKEKINPDLAFFFLILFYPFEQDNHSSKTAFDEEDTESIISTVDKYDWALDVTTGTEQYLKNFLAGNAVGQSSVKFSPNAVTSPVNILWGPVASNTKDLYGTFLSNTYGKSHTILSTKSRKSTGLSMGTKMADSNRVYTRESIVDLMKLEEKRLCL